MQSRSTVTVLALLGLAACGPAAAQGPSPGETSPLLACFYECKEGHEYEDTWQEVTSLMVESLEPGSGQTTSIALVIRGGISAQPPVARIDFTLGPNDLDEVNICRSLESAGLPIPEAGLIEVMQRDVVLEPGSPTARVYAWVKNLVGSFPKTINEPFQGRVQSVGKTECRVVPTETDEMRERLEDVAGVTAIDPVLIEGTLDPQIVLDP